MNEIVRWWTAGRVQKRFFIRWWGSRYVFRDAWLWMTGRAPWYDRWHRPLEASCYGYRGQAKCYCLTGRTTHFSFRLFTCGFWGELSRDYTKRPCSCDKIMWLLFPESYADEIEEYGLDRLRDEFPGVGPLEG